MPRILIVLSAASHWTRADGSLYASGVWAEEFVEIDDAFLRAGFRVDIASPGGRSPTIDLRSLDPHIVGEDLSARMRTYLTGTRDRWHQPLVLADIDSSSYDAIVIPGGHGPVEDLYKDADMGRVLVDADQRGRLVAAVCHGPAALLSARTTDGRWPFAGRRMAAFSNEEEIDFGTADNSAWMLASALHQLGADYSQGPNWQSFVVRHDNLITGQNPASSTALAAAVVAALR